MTNEFNDALTQLDTISTRNIDRGWYNIAREKDVLDIAQLCRSKVDYYTAIAKLRQHIKHPTRGMISLVKEHINAQRHIILFDYHSPMHKCSVIHRCPVYHLLHSLRELPSEMCAPRELILVTNLLVAQHKLGWLWHEFRFIQGHGMTLRVSHLTAWVELNMTNTDSSQASVGYVYVLLLPNNRSK